MTPHAVRYYARIGLLKPTRNQKNRYKNFPESDAKRVHFIRKAQDLGFTLGEVTEIMTRSAHRRTPCPMVRDIIHVSR